MDVSSGTRGSVVTFLPQEVLLVDTTNSLHPFFMHQLDVGPIRLASISYAFNYRVTVLRDNIKSTTRVGCSQRAAGRILEDIGLPCGHQVAVMFQIVCALVLEVPSVLLDLESLHGLSPNVILACEPWGHMDHGGGGCECLSSDSAGAYVHDLSLASCGRDSSPVKEEAPSAGARDEDSSVRSVDFRGIVSRLARVRGTRGRYPLCLISQGLMAVYVRWKTGLLVASDWLRPVPRGGGTGGRLRQSQCGVCLLVWWIWISPLCRMCLAFRLLTWLNRLHACCRDSFPMNAG